MNYAVDFDIQSKRLTPTNKRGGRQLAWLRALIAPLNSLNESFFVVYFDDLVNRAKRTGQKIVMEDFLNSDFPSGVPGKKIFIDNTGDNIEVDYFYNEIEDYEAVFFYNESEGEEAEFIYNEAEIQSNSDFIVYVPYQVFALFPENIVYSEIDKHRPAATSYQIIQI